MSIFIIAEIGINHNGDLGICEDLIKVASESGCDAVKLQKRSNKNLYTKNFFNSIYDNKNSYGKTYGEHREFLEFSESQYLELIEYSKEIGITFFAPR